MSRRRQGNRPLGQPSGEPQSADAEHVAAEQESSRSDETLPAESSLPPEPPLAAEPPPTIVSELEAAEHGDIQAAARVASRLLRTDAPAVPDPPSPGAAVTCRVVSAGSVKCDGRFRPSGSTFKTTVAQAKSLGTAVEILD